MSGTAVSTVGALLPRELLDRVANNDPKLPGLDAADFDLAPSERPRDAVTRSWNRLVSVWTAFRRAEETLADADDKATRLTRERWLLPLLNELGFAGLDAVQSLTPDADGKSYAISHEWRGRVPIHLMGWRTPIDRRTPGLRGAAAASPHGLVQEFLNRSDSHLWGIVSNGKTLRLLRDNASLTRQAYVEFDLAAIFDGESFADFTLLWLCCYRTRFEGDIPQRCLLEQWSKEAASAGTRAREKLRSGVEQAIICLGNGALAHPANAALRGRLRSSELAADDLQRQLLRIVYRMLFLCVAESRDLLLDPDAPDAARDTYRRFYSMDRLRRLANKRRGGTHGDLWQGLHATMAALDVGDDQPKVTARDALGLTSLGSQLWSQQAIPDLADAHIDNAHLLEAVRNLAFVRDDEAKGLRPVDYQNLGTEELGSVYESLLELHAVADPEDRTFGLGSAAGSERKTTGSYYTPPELISRLLDDALDPVIEEAMSKPNPERALLDLKMLDPACGSGHFLIAAAHRIADALASAREDGAEPSPEASRAALREVVGHCLYGIDINPMAVELCKVSLWLESNTPGKPLSFLDHRIVCGNSLLGATPKLLAEGIPDAAFRPLTGDDRQHVSALRKANRKERKHANQPSLGLDWSSSSDTRQLAGELSRIDATPDDTADQVAAKETDYARLRAAAIAVKAKLVADTWCTAFVAPKRTRTPAITEGTLRAIQRLDLERAASVVGQARGLVAAPPSPVDTTVVRTVLDAVDQYQFSHMHLTFPDVFRVPEEAADATNHQTGWSGGFDAILSNPPWERVKLQEKEFFAQQDEMIATAPTAAVRKRLIEDLKTNNPGLRVAFERALREAEGMSALLRNSERFPLGGRGDVNTYAVFVELMADAVSPRGRVGAILPTGIATDDTTKHLFGQLVENRRLFSLYDFENRKKIFPAVHRSMKFCLITLTGSKAAVSQAAFSFFALDVTHLENNDRRFTLNSEDFNLLNPNTKTCPIFRTVRDAEIAKAIYRRLPVLIDETSPDGNPWGVSFQSMFHMSNDSHLFHTREQLESQGYVLEGNHFVLRDAPSNGDERARYLPLYEGKMATFFDHRAADVVKSATAVHRQNQPRYLSSDEKAMPSRSATSLYWVEDQRLNERCHNEHNWNLGFNDITSVTNERTVVCTALPRVAVGHSEPILLATKDRHLLLCNLCSFVLDYTARQKVGGNHITYSYLRQLPVLSPRLIQRHRTLVEASMLELVYTAWDMVPFAQDLRYEGPPFRWNDKRRSQIRAELDALMFHLYGINRGDAGYIMETFPIVQRKDMTECGEFRTKRLILDRYDAMTEAFDATYGSLANTPNGESPPQDQSSLSTYSRQLAEALDMNYQTNVDPPPAHPSQTHSASTRPAWAQSDIRMPPQRENQDHAIS